MYFFFRGFRLFRGSNCFFKVQQGALRFPERSGSTARVLVEMTLLMKPQADDTLRTSWTLVARLKNVSDHDAWREFYELYNRLVLGVALKSGLRHDEAEEVLQETMSSVSSHINDFKADPARGSFRAWLLQMARWRIKDQLRKRLPVAASGDRASDGTDRTPTVERVPDGREVDLEGLCDAEWRERLTEEAFKQLRFEAKADQYQIFHLLVVERKTPAEVARMLGRSQAHVYLVKHRVGRALKKIVRRLEEKLG
ncbi:MAG: sigma-70 family RNA polymerase sigma factor [Pedosphaera sp.]|nr:sigma-70 family RNA polymerase sigma factor [Pedosphaera sp.]